MGEKIVGILGGMGPEATVELMRRIIVATPAKVDNDHIHCIVDQNSKVPNRVLSIEGKIPSAGPVLAQMAQRLEHAGADMLCMPCNTAHYYLDEIRAASALPFIDMLDATVRYIRAQFPAAQRVAVLCTEGTRRTGLYERRMAPHGLEAVYPPQDMQDVVSDIIATVKGGDSGAGVRQRFLDIVAKMRAHNVQVQLAACTELSVICPNHEEAADVVDALDCLVREVVRQARQ